MLLSTFLGRPAFSKCGEIALRSRTMRLLRPSRPQFRVMAAVVMVVTADGEGVASASCAEAFPLTDFAAFIPNR